MDNALVKAEYIFRLIEAFPGSFVNTSNEFIAQRRANEYFLLDNCKSELDVKCKVLEWLSRAAYKTEPFKTDSANDKFHNFMLSGINYFLQASFSEDDIEIIYTKLGNCCDHDLTIDFINSGYTMDLLHTSRQ